MVKAPGEIFTQTAIGVIYDYCKGIPRKVNKVATACLMAAVGQNQKLIGDHFVRVVNEINIEGIQAIDFYRRTDKQPDYS